MGIILTSGRKPPSLKEIEAKGCGGRVNFFRREEEGEKL
jgi:hypothetical protein